jgi:exoribonuclease-2
LFREDGDGVRAATAAEAAAAEGKAARKERERVERDGFLARAKTGRLDAGDARFLGEIEALACGRSSRSPLLSALGRKESPESAHAFLLACGAWNDLVNPWPSRAGCPLKPPSAPLATAGGSARRDLRGLRAYAIDNPWSRDPDDAISIDGDTLWVHVADPEAAVPAGSAVDLEALERGQTLYLPELQVPMLPVEAVERFGLGLADESPALSFAFRLDDSGGAECAEIVRSTARVTRMTYPEADAALRGESTDEEVRRDLHALEKAAERRRAFRAANGSVEIEIPEIRLRVDSGDISIERAGPWRSASIVRECMFAAGETAARWAFSRGIPFPYYGQESPADGSDRGDGLSAMFARRRRMKAGAFSTTPNAHRGAGLPFYAQVTSPLRRYVDLVAHRQIAAALAGGTVLDAGTIVELVGAAQAASAANRQAERESEAFWTIAWLGRHPGWEGDAVGIGADGSSVWLPALGMETRLRNGRVRPDETARVRLETVDLAFRTCSFGLVS